MNKTTSSLLFICNGSLLLLPSKSTRKEANQFDPPSCSVPFTSEQARLAYVYEWFQAHKYSKKAFRQNFVIEKEPIKFKHTDKILGEKLCTAYTIYVKNDSMLTHLVKQKNGIWEDLETIIRGESSYYITDMFLNLSTRALERINKTEVYA
jgi:hypothetical protein